MVHHQPADQPRVGIALVLHLHHLDHVQVDGLAFLADGKDGVDDGFGQSVCEFLADFGAERGAGDGEEGFAVDGCFGGDLDRVQELLKRRIGVTERSQDSRLQFKTHGKSLLLGNIETFGNNPRVQAFRDIPLRLFQEFADNEHVRCRSIPGNLVLCRRRTRNHGRSRVLNLLISLNGVRLPGSATRKTKVVSRACSHHFAQEHLAVLCELNVPGTADQPV
jgi:hypothetical protein